MRITQNTSLAPFTSLHVGGPAQTLIQLETGDSLVDAVKQATGPVTVLGYGSNSLVSDSGLTGSVILNRGGGTSQIKTLDDLQLRVDASVPWDSFVQKTIQLGLYGLEFTSGIPGGMGAAIVGNIAAYGQQVADCLVEVTVLQNGQATTWPAEKLKLSYRRSCLLEQPDVIVLDATFKLSTIAKPLQYQSALKVAHELGLPADSLSQRRQIILEARRRAGSLLEDNTNGTAGSFFKNPLVSAKQRAQLAQYDEFGTNAQQSAQQNKLHSGQSNRVSAAHVLLAAGFQRGQAWGPVRLHPDHILKLENTGKASAQQIYDVAQEIITTVQAKLGITLEPEVRYLGQFS